jgi:hypothetical protein
LLKVSQEAYTSESLNSNNPPEILAKKSDTSTDWNLLIFGITTLGGAI